jgi:hypothetical protein
MRSIRRLLVLVAGTIVALTVLSPSVSTLVPSVSASSPRYGNLHVTKACSAYTGSAGSFCTITSSNLKAIKVGSKIVYAQAAGKTALNSDIVLVAGSGNTAVGHCYLGYSTAAGDINGLGQCTFSGGTGNFSGFQASVVVTASSTVAKGWNWDGTYSFVRTD